MIDLVGNTPLVWLSRLTDAPIAAKIEAFSPGGSLKEILGDNVLYFSPDSAEELAEKIELLIENDRIKKEFEIKGFVRSSRFRWDKTIDQYLSVLIDK